MFQPPPPPPNGTSPLSTNVVAQQPVPQQVRPVQQQEVGSQRPQKQLKTTVASSTSTQGSGQAPSKTTRTNTITRRGAPQGQQRLMPRYQARAEQPVPQVMRPPPPPPPPPRTNGMVPNKRKLPNAHQNVSFHNMKRARPGVTHSMAQQTVPSYKSRESTGMRHAARPLVPGRAPQMMRASQVTQVYPYAQQMRMHHNPTPYYGMTHHAAARIPSMNAYPRAPAGRQWVNPAYYRGRYFNRQIPRVRTTPDLPAKPRYGSSEKFVDLTSDVMSEKEDMRILYGTLKALLFGPTTSQDLIKVGYEIRLQRRLGGIGAMDDIDVAKIDTNQIVGNVDVITARAFVKLIERDQIQVKGEVIEFEPEFFEDHEDFQPREGRYAARLKLNIYGQYNRAEACALELKQHESELQWDHRHPSFQLPNASNRRRGTPQSPSVEITKIENDFNNIFSDAMSTENIKPMNPGKKLKAKLLEYQKVGLSWMCNREKKKHGKSLFWVEKENQRGYTYWENTATGQRNTMPPEEFRGGILADDMGLGKTIQSISLICTSQVDKGPSLIVAPLSVLDTWVKQIKEHTHRGELKICEYYGPQREKDPCALTEFDIVITTYNIVSQEWSEIYGTKKKSKRKKDEDEDDDKDLDSDVDMDSFDEDEEETQIDGIHAVDWLRVVLDEAHQIRSRKTKTFKAVSALKADCRWCLTGTPVQNKLDDLYSLICFLRVEPFTSQSTWKQLIQQPLKHQDTAGFEKLRKLMQYICLRRTKEQKLGDKPIVRLPPKKILHEKLHFDEEELKLYKHLESRSKKKFKKMTSKSLLENYAHVLEMLLRLRQCCGHPSLVPRSYLLNEKGQKKGNDEELVDLLKELSDCNICWKLAVDPVITSCKHMFCRKCLTKEASRYPDPHHAPCPFCQEDVDLLKVIDASMLDAEQHLFGGQHDQPLNGFQREANEFVAIRDDYVRRENGQLKPSAKIRALINFVLNRPVGGLNKSVVFSQWTSMLDLVEECLSNEGIQSVRLDGSMARRAREESFQAFQNDPNKLVFLLSLKAGNLGLNLTAANRVFLLDPWWNPSQEDQAIDRVHRLGQVRPVQVIRFVMAGSVEEKIISLQDKKRKLAQGALGNMSKEELREMMMEDLKSLFT